MSVFVFSLLARSFTCRSWTAVIWGAATACALFMLVVSGGTQSSLEGLAEHVGAAAALVAAALLAQRLLRGRTTSRGSAAASEPEARPFVRHWRGDVSLALAFGHFVVFSAAAAWTAALLSIAPMYPHMRLVAGAVVLAWPTVLAGAVWALVGLWRAAGAHVRRGRFRALGWAARGAAIPGWLLLAGAVCFEVPADLREYGRTAFGPSERGTYAIRILRAGAEIEHPN